MQGRGNDVVKFRLGTHSLDPLIPVVPASRAVKHKTSSLDGKYDHRKGRYTSLLVWWFQVRREPFRFLAFGMTLLIVSFVVCFHQHQHNRSNIWDRTAPRIPRALQVDNNYVPIQSEWKRLRKSSRTVTPLSTSLDSSKHIHEVRSDEEETGCSYIADWQKRKSLIPTCNSMHEVGWTAVEFLDSGGYNDVWRVYTTDDRQKLANYVIKTGTYAKNSAYTPRYMDNYRRDAMVLEQTSASPYVMDMYAACGSATVVEAASGTLKNWLQWHQADAKPIEILRLASNVAHAVADMQLYHNGMPTLASADIKISQFLTFTGSSVVKVNDFNRGVFLTSKEPPKICPFILGNHHRGSTNRSPEEYTDRGQQTDKIDVFSTGSLFYTLLTGKAPFYNKPFRKAMDLIKTGVQPPLPSKIEQSKDPSIVAVVEVMKWCRQFYAKDRPNSKQVAARLADALKSIEAELVK